MFELTLNLPVRNNKKFGKSRRRVALMKQMGKLKYPSEFKRRSRTTLDYKHYKGAEFRNYGCFAFHIIAELFPPGSDIRRLWIITGYILRINLLEDDEYLEARSATRVPITEIYRRWMRTFEAIFGKEAMVHNVHMFSHLNIARKLGPFYATSLFREESSYGRLQKRFRAGTTNVGKQGMLNYLYSEMVLGHRDQRCPSFNTRDLKQTDDSLMYLESGDFVKLVAQETVGDCTKYFVKRFQTEAYRPTECPDLTFTKIQVRKVVTLNDEQEELDLEDPVNRVKGKAIHAKNLLLAVPSGILMEEL